MPGRSGVPGRMSCPATCPVPSILTFTPMRSSVAIAVSGSYPLMSGIVPDGDGAAVLNFLQLLMPSMSRMYEVLKPGGAVNTGVDEEWRSVYAAASHRPLSGM